MPTPNPSRKREGNIDARHPLPIRGEGLSGSRKGAKIAKASASDRRPLSALWLHHNAPCGFLAARAASLKSESLFPCYLFVVASLMQKTGAHFSARCSLPQAQHLCVLCAFARNIKKLDPGLRRGDERGCAATADGGGPRWFGQSQMPTPNPSRKREGNNDARHPLS